MKTYRVEVCLPHVKAKNRKSAEKKVLNWFKKRITDKYSIDVYLDEDD